MLLRTATEAATAIRTPSPVVASYVSPLKNAVVASETGRKLQINAEFSRWWRRQRVSLGSSWCVNFVAFEASVGFSLSVEVAELEVEISHVIGCQLHVDRNSGSWRVRLHDDPLSHRSTQLVHPRHRIIVPVTAMSALSSVLVPLNCVTAAEALKIRNRFENLNLRIF